MWSRSSTALPRSTTARHCLHIASFLVCKRRHRRRRRLHSDHQRPHRPLHRHRHCHQFRRRRRDRPPPHRRQPRCPRLRLFLHFHHPRPVHRQLDRQLRLDRRHPPFRRRRCHPSRTRRPQFRRRRRCFAVLSSMSNCTRLPTLPRTQTTPPIAFELIAPFISLRARSSQCACKARRLRVKSLLRRKLSLPTRTA